MTHSRAELELLDMKALREIGKQFGVTDTKKEELINEILQAQPREAVQSIDKLIEDIERTKGDFVQTYELRDRIISALRGAKESGYHG